MTPSLKVHPALIVAFTFFSPGRHTHTISGSTGAATNRPPGALLRRQRLPHPVSRRSERSRRPAIAPVNGEIVPFNEAQPRARTANTGAASARTARAAASSRHRPQADSSDTPEQAPCPGGCNSLPISPNDALVLGHGRHAHRRPRSAATRTLLRRYTAGWTISPQFPSFPGSASGANGLPPTLSAPGFRSRSHQISR